MTGSTARPACGGQQPSAEPPLATPADGVSLSGGCCEASPQSIRPGWERESNAVESAVVVEVGSFGRSRNRYISFDWSRSLLAYLPI